MPEITPNLGLKKPLGNETVSRAAFNENWDIIDAQAQKNIGQGPTAPAYPVEGNLWIDTSTTPNTLKRYVGGAWVKVGGITPAEIGAATQADLDALEAAHAAHLADNMKHVTKDGTLQSGLNADQVDGANAGTGANNVLKLDASGLVPLGNIPGTLTGKNADQLDGYHAGNSSGQIPVSNGTVCTNLNADAVDGLHVTGSSTPGLRKITISTSDPSGGSDGDVWFKYTA